MSPPVELDGAIEEGDIDGDRAPGIVASGWIPSAAVRLATPRGNDDRRPRGPNPPGQRGLDLGGRLSRQRGRPRRTPTHPIWRDLPVDIRSRERSTSTLNSGLPEQPSPPAARANLARTSPTR